MQIYNSSLTDLETRLSDLKEVTRAKDLNKEAVIQKIQIIERSLNEQNSINLDQLKAHDKKNSEWQNLLAARKKELRTQKKDILEYTDDLINAGNKMMADQAAGRPVKSPPLSIRTFDEEIILKAYDLSKRESTQLRDLLAENLNLNARVHRSFIGAISWALFRFNLALARALSIICTITFAYLIELLIEKQLENWPKYFVALVVALAVGFSIDLLIEKQATRYFWRNGARWHLALVRQLTLLRQHIEAINRFEIEYRSTNSMTKEEKQKEALQDDALFNGKCVQLRAEYLMAAPDTANLTDVIDGLVSIEHANYITNYSGNVSGLINHALRCDYIGLTTHMKDFEQNLEQALLALPSFDNQTIYRMEKRGPAVEIYRKYFMRQKDCVLNIPCYLSSSTKKWDCAPVVYQITTLKSNSFARDVSRITNNAIETEVLCLKNMHVFIKGINNIDGQLVIKMEETIEPAIGILNYYDDPDADLAYLNEKPGIFD